MIGPVSTCRVFAREKALSVLATDVGSGQIAPGETALAPSDVLA